MQASARLRHYLVSKARVTDKDSGLQVFKRTTDMRNIC